MIRDLSVWDYRAQKKLALPKSFGPVKSYWFAHSDIESVTMEMDAAEL